MKLFSALGRLRVTPSPGLAPAKRDSRVDALRGFAACSVVSVHLFATNTEGNTLMNPPAEVISYLHFSRAAVLLFFVLSGFVIGLACQTAPTPDLIRDYFRRRALRILPILWLGVLAGCLVIPEPSLVKLLFNVLLMNNADWGPGYDTLYGNYALWSLHYEAVYYLGFVWVWRAAPRAVPLFALFIVLAAAGWVHGGVLAALGGWSAGACFWIGGLLLAWQGKPVPPRPVLALLLATYATNHLWPGIVLLNGLGIPYAGRGGLQLSDLALLPGCVLIFCSFVGREFRGLALVRMAAFAIPLGTVALLALMGRLGDSLPWRLAGGAALLSLLLLAFERVSWSERLLHPFAPIGAISYALYLFHMPVIYFVAQLRQQDSLALGYGSALLLALGLSFGLAYLAERQMQPWLVALCRRPKTFVSCTRAS